MTTGRGLLTPTKISAWLECAHFLTLKHREEAGTLTVDPQGFGAFAQLLMDKGQIHEQACLAEYLAQGRSVHQVPGRNVDQHESFAAWVARIGNPLALGHDVIFQMPFVHQGMRGVADFVVRVDDPESGTSSYEPVDAKLARKAAKPGHVLQLCFYANAIDELTGTAPEHVHVWLGSNEQDTIRTRDVLPYWNRLRGQLAAVLAEEVVDAQTVPEPCDHCDFCEFNGLCEQQWRDADALHYVAGIRQGDQAALATAGVETLAGLAELAADEPVEDLQPDRLLRIHGQAELQVEAREDAESPHPPFRIVEPGEDPVWGHGFEELPPPDDGDIFLDYEGHPFWRADTGLFFLFGLIERDDDGTWVYRAWWAHDRDEEAVATKALIDHLVARRDAHPGMHVHHYNHTERTALETLAAEHGVEESTLASLVETGLFVDLLTVVRNAVQVGIESYGLKHTERLTDYVRGHAIDQGAGAVVEYETFTAGGDQECLTRIAAYNEDDVRATMALRDWLVDQRPANVTWREVVKVAEPPDLELDEQVEALHAFPADSPEHLLGHLLGYWLRERRAHVAPKLAKLDTDGVDLYDDPEVIAGLRATGLIEKLGKRGTPITPNMGFAFPSQTLGEDFDPEELPTKVFFAGEEGAIAFRSVVSIDPEAGTLEMPWNTEAQELGIEPTLVVHDDWFDPRDKPVALAELAARVLDPAGAPPPNPAAMALLRRDLPSYAAGHGPVGGHFTADLGAVKGQITHLDRSYLAVQGPPGTGKTYWGAHLVHELVLAGKRVGITAQSHAAIDNLLAETERVFAAAGDGEKLDALHKDKPRPGGGVPGVVYKNDNKEAAKPSYNVVGGTTWLFAGNHLEAAPVDVLIVDEAGQLALADSLAATRHARNLILLGDPLQLAQVSQASHPAGAGASVLEHLLDGGAVLPPERGVFLHETRRMHPDVCRFISDQIYEGQLTTHDQCSQQSVAHGTGLRWLQVDHHGCSTESEVEAQAVQREVDRLIGTAWTDQRGEAGELGPGDIMVVAPYNAQVRLLRRTLDAHDRTRGVLVGTVDKFQGREAPVVFFTMTTSSTDDMTRGADFLFSRNRLNVAISRAQCLAYLVCTEGLLNSRAKTVEEMKLISTLCAFAEYAS